METKVFDISAQSHGNSPVFAIFQSISQHPAPETSQCSGWNHGELFLLLKHVNVTLKLGCESATWQVCDGVK